MADAVDLSYVAQLLEGMANLERYGLAYKYCGAGYGGYVLHLFKNAEERAKYDKLMPIEPYIQYRY